MSTTARTAELRKYLLDELAECRAMAALRLPALPPQAQARWRQLEFQVDGLQRALASADAPPLSQSTIDEVRQSVAEAALLFAESCRWTRPPA